MLSCACLDELLWSVSGLDFEIDKLQLQKDSVYFDVLIHCWIQIGHGVPVNGLFYTLRDAKFASDAPLGVDMSHEE